MKKLFFSFSFLFFLGTTQAQFGAINPDLYDGVAEKTTLLVSTGEEGLDKLILEKMDIFWDLNDYELIFKEDLETYRGKPEYLFLTVGTYEFTRTSPYMEYSVLKFFLTDDLNKTKRGEINYDNVSRLAMAQFDLLETENPTLMLEAEVQKCIQLLLNHCQLVVSDGFPTKRITIKDYLAYVSELRKDRIKEQELWLQENGLRKNINTLDKVGGVYEHPFIFRTQEEIYSSIIAGDERGSYFIFYQDLNLTYWIALDAQTSEILYGEVATGLKQRELDRSLFKTLNN